MDGSTCSVGGAAQETTSLDEPASVLSVENDQPLQLDGETYALAKGAQGDAIDDALSYHSSVSSFTPRVYRLPREEWVPPSRRPRSLDGAKLFTVRGSKFGKHQKTYGKRRHEKDEKGRMMALGLLQYLRLQSYTARPCLGLVHMQRKTEYVSKIIVACLWFRDLARGKPSIWKNEVTSEWRYVRYISGVTFCDVRYI